MKTSLECMECNVKQLVKVSKLLGVSAEKQEQASRRLFSMLSNVNFNLPNPQVMEETWKIITSAFANDDPYLEIKKEYNDLLLDAFCEIEEIINHASNSYLAGLKIAVTGNLIDFAAKHKFSKDELLERVRNYDNISFAINDAVQLEHQLKKANSLFYIGDNCGEIVLDKLFIQVIKKMNPEIVVYFGVRGGPILNDVTVNDAIDVGMNDVAMIVSSGVAAPGVLLDKSTSEFVNLFEKCDVVIAKGQGNYESLNDIKKDNLYLLLMVKCPYIASEIKVQTMDYIIKKNIQ
ncbi:MAG: DUF89 family protein [Bacilli bacterium]|nr:DUF89 family protein [Bacilli bacterium]